jgi:hypothetical protein
MINLDMVGRLRDDQLLVLGTESAPQWNALLDAAAAAQGLKVTGRGDGYGPSDQTSFYAAGIPVLHLFTGTHEQYHSPADKAATLNAEGAARIAELTAVLASRVARGDATPVYARASAPPAREGDSRGYGAYLGTVPDYRSMEQETGGVLLADTRAGGPADRAGVRKGDRIVEMAGTRIENLHDMTFALQDHRPGETIEVVVVRGAERVTLRATLGERADDPVVGVLLHDVGLGEPCLLSGVQATGGIVRCELPEYIPRPPCDPCVASPIGAVARVPAGEVEAFLFDDSRDPQGDDERLTLLISQVDLGARSGFANGGFRRQSAEPLMQKLYCVGDYIDETKGFIGEIAS